MAMVSRVRKSGPIRHEARGSGYLGPIITEYSVRLSRNTVSVPSVDVNTLSFSIRFISGTPGQQNTRSASSHSPVDLFMGPR